MSRKTNVDQKKKKPRHSPYYYKRIRRGLFHAFFLAAIACALYGFSVWRAGAMIEQQAAERWETEGSYAQISVFFPKGKGLKPDDTMYLKAQLLQKLASDSVINAETESGNIPVMDCYSTSETVEVRAGAVLVNAEAISTGGGFFIFHPVMLLSGSYYLPENLMKDQILLDEETAWTLFGAYDVENRTVSIGEMNYVIAGVFRKPSYGFPIRTTTDTPVVFVPFGSSTSASASASGQAEGSGNEAAQSTEEEITCYEILVPNPVEGYARGAVLNVIGADESQVICIDNTARYTKMGLLGKILSLGTWGTRNAPIQLPYWENAAGSLEEILAVLLFIEALLAALAIKAVIQVIVFIYANRRWSLTGSIHSMQEAVYRRQSEKLYPEYYAQQEKERQAEEEEVK